MRIVRYLGGGKLYPTPFVTADTLVVSIYFCFTNGSVGKGRGDMSLVDIIKKFHKKMATKCSLIDFCPRGIWGIPSTGSFPRGWVSLVSCPFKGHIIHGVGYQGGIKEVEYEDSRLSGGYVIPYTSRSRGYFGAVLFH